MSLNACHGQVCAYAWQVKVWHTGVCWKMDLQPVTASRFLYQVGSKFRWTEQFPFGDVSKMNGKANDKNAWRPRENRNYPRKLKESTRPGLMFQRSSKMCLVLYQNILTFFYSAYVYIHILIYLYCASSCINTNIEMYRGRCNPHICGT